MRSEILLSSAPSLAGIAPDHRLALSRLAAGRWLEEGWPIPHVQEALGLANLSQTSTYLHAAEMGLQESMRRFDAARAASDADFRGKTVANHGQKEQRSLCHDETENDGKDLLH
jgi:hypothetical protein